MTEVWKGPKTASVEFLASPTWVCDISDAKPDETVLLFLGKGKEAGWVINCAGRGRLPLRSLDGKTYVTFAGVILPPGTPSITVPVGSDGGTADSIGPLNLTRHETRDAGYSGQEVSQAGPRQPSMSEIPSFPRSAWERLPRRSASKQSGIAGTRSVRRVISTPSVATRRLR